MVDMGKPDVIAASETWITSEVFDNETQLTGSLSSRVDILYRRWGGVILYTKSTSTILAVETPVHDSGTCKLVRWKLKCRRQELVVEYPECVLDDFLLIKLKSWCNRGKSLMVGEINALHTN